MTDAAGRTGIVVAGGSGDEVALTNLSNESGGSGHLSRVLGPDFQGAALGILA